MRKRNLFPSLSEKNPELTGLENAETGMWPLMFCTRCSMDRPTAVSVTRTVTFTIAKGNTDSSARNLHIYTRIFQKRSKVSVNSLSGRLQSSDYTPLLPTQSTSPSLPHPFNPTHPLFPSFLTLSPPRLVSPFSPTTLPRPLWCTAPLSAPLPPFAPPCYSFSLFPLLLSNPFPFHPSSPRRNPFSASPLSVLSTHSYLNSVHCGSQFPNPGEKTMHIHPIPACPGFLHMLQGI